MLAPLFVFPLPTCEYPPDRATRSFTMILAVHFSLTFTWFGSRAVFNREDFANDARRSPHTA
jgi:hypothetical protein